MLTLMKISGNLWINREKLVVQTFKTRSLILKDKPFHIVGTTAEKYFLLTTSKCALSDHVVISRAQMSQARVFYT